MYSKFCPNKIKNGYLLAWKNDGTFLANMISYMTSGVYTHVGIAWTLHNRAYVLDAYHKGGVRLRYLGDDLPVDIIKTDIKWTNDLEDDALSKLGRSYNYIGAAMLGFNLTPSYDADVCSLYAASILRKGGVDIPKVALTPQKLVDIICASKNTQPVSITNLKGLKYD